ncbi:MAG: hypothetical protein JWQ71_1256, partial [Pedosphaera sp.]|nr:hypothetical protein [Pedosphaera sp.]
MAGQVSGSKLAHHIFFMTGRTVGLKARRRNDLGFMRRVQPDEKLSVVTGGEPLPRSELTKRLWNYIQKNGLQ